MSEEQNFGPLTVVTQPLAVADWLARRDDILRRCAAVTTVEGPDEFLASAALQADLGKAIKSLANRRLETTRPIDDIKKQILDQERALTLDMNFEHDRLRRLNGEYATRLAREREAIERARREAEAEAAMRAAEEEENRRRAEAVFGPAAAEPQPATVTQILPEVPAAARSSSVKTVTVYEFEITDPAALAKKFLSPDERKIRAFVQTLKVQDIDPATVVEPGLRITKSVRVDGK